MRQLQNDPEKIRSFYQNHRSNMPPDGAFAYGLINRMPGVNLKNMDVDALLGLRIEVDSALTERARDLQRQLGLLGEGRRRPGRPHARVGRASTLRGVKVAPKYRGPEGETWAGRGVTPKWLTALIEQGHSIEDFAIAPKGGRAANPGAKKAKRTSLGIGS